MSALAIIASARPELSALACRSLARFAPNVRIWAIETRGREAREHAQVIEWGRTDLNRGSLSRDIYEPVDQVILFDDDAVVLSEAWLPTLRGYHDKGFAIVGGLRHRGHVEQVMVDGVLIPHAHCLSFTRQAFERVTSFHAVAEPGVPFLRYDTCVKAVLDIALTEPVKVLPFFTLGKGLTYPGLPIAEYFDPEVGHRPLWAHLGRGTSFAPRSSSRERWRRLAARMGFPRAQKILRRQKLREDFIRLSEQVLAC